jgi:hypothetical protein
MSVGAGGEMVVILGSGGSEKNAEAYTAAYKASGEDDSLHCEHRKRVNFGELVGL